MVSSTRYSEDEIRASLTPTERTVMIAVSEGRTGSEIAAQLGNSVFTVRAHIRSVISKLDVSGRIAAAHRARQLGLIP